MRLLYLSMEHDQLLSQHGILDDQISAATSQVYECPHCDASRHGFAPLLEIQFHTVDKSFQRRDEGFDHVVNYISVSGLARMIPDFQALGITISQKFRWMS